MGKFHSAASGIDHLERLAQQNTCIHRLHPGVKALTALLYIAVVVSVPNPVRQAGPDSLTPESALTRLVPFALYPVVLCVLAEVPVTAVIARLPAALPFALAGGLSNLFMMREPAFTLGHSVITLGMISFCCILLKTVLSVSAALILIATTPFAALAGCLTAPPFLRPLGLQLTLTYRYINVLLGEAHDMWIAYRLRSPESRAVRINDFGPFLGQLLLRSFDRANAVYHAMLCRGFSGVYHSAAQRHPHTSDWLFAAGAFAAFCFLRAVNLSLLLGRLAMQI
ncbi:MAG: energy-coupling factor transporter transmembrane protein EcfT [Spirochaetaceae bacterium]|jgi:cobalt/nickel transport system permease protein|nr:energy-coupling factor transporter transmembrane protein EcfT [Spirochaetaceae bacterium]